MITALKEWITHTALPKRQPVTWRSVLPLAIFLLVFGALVITLESRGLVRFTHRWVFLLVAVAPWVWWWHCHGYGGLSRGRAQLALAVRFVLVGLFVMLLAGPRAVRENDQLAVMYALDLSDSMGRQVTDEAIRYILDTVSSKEEEDQVGLVLFGRDAAVELPPQQSFPFEAINSQLSRGGTDIEEGLSLAAAVIPEENPGRIVLISDGTATEGSLIGILDQLGARGIAVDVLPVQMHLEKEVWLERIDLPAQVKLGESYEANVLLTAIHSGSGTLLVHENGREIYRENVNFTEGKNRITLPIYLREPGYYEYSARLITPEGEDGWEGNNRAINDLFLRGQGKTLVVTDPNGNARDWEPLVRAMQESERIVEVRDAFAFPRTAISLMPYDSVIFVNVPADAFDVVQLDAVKTAVYNQGIGFLMVGGENSFGPGGYHRTPIEEALPVEMDIKQKKVLPKGALAMILHTCEFTQGNTWAKRIAKQAIRVLGSEDEVGVIDNENGGANWVFEMTKADDYEKLAMLINQASPGDMQAFGPTMELGFEALAANDAAMRHMIIISDGDPSPPTPALMDDFVKEKISISTIAINPHGPNDTAILEGIAKTTGGRYYFPQDPALLPSIFIKEAKTLKRSMIQNKQFTPRVEFPSPVLKGIEAIPDLFGYVLTSAKARSHTVLKGPDDEDLNPVLAVWRYGTGASAAFTSDLSTNWAKHWVSWDHYRAFVSQLLTEISRTDSESEINLQVTASGNQGVITVEDHADEAGFLEMQARVMGPEKREETIVVKQVAPRRYQGTFPLWGTGRYQIMAAAAGSNRSDKAISGLSVAYSPEYLQLHSNTKALERIAQHTGGRVLDGRETALFDFERQSKESSRSIIDWFLLLLACLVPLDVGLRRVHLDFSVMRSWFKRKKAEESGATLSALLRRKADVGASRKPSPMRGTQQDDQPAVRKKPPAIQKTEGAPQAEKTTQDDASLPVSTTGKLLALKRKRQEQEGRERD